MKAQVARQMSHLWVSGVAAIIAVFVLIHFDRAAHRTFRLIGSCDGDAGITAETEGQHK